MMGKQTEEKRFQNSLDKALSLQEQIDMDLDWMEGIPVVSMVQRTEVLVAQRKKKKEVRQVQESEVRKQRTQVEQRQKEQVQEGHVHREEQLGEVKHYVVVDWMAGTQSLGKAVRLMQKRWKKKKVANKIHYVGVDKMRHVYSAITGGWVENIEADLMTTSPAQLWEAVQEEVWRRLKTKVKLTPLLVGMSPCCRTFSRTDSMNVEKGNHYRLHGREHPDRPPRDNTSEKGKMARRADKMVQVGHKVAKWAEEQGAAWYMENPVGWHADHTRYSGRRGERGRGGSRERRFITAHTCTCITNPRISGPAC